MGFLDKIKGRSGDLEQIKARATKLAREHGDKIDQAAVKAKESADKLGDDPKGGPAAPRGPQA